MSTPFRPEVLLVSQQVGNFRFRRRAIIRVSFLAPRRPLPTPNSRRRRLLGLVILCLAVESLSLDLAAPWPSLGSIHLSGLTPSFSPMETERRTRSLAATDRTFFSAVSRATL